MVQMQEIMEMSVEERIMLVEKIWNSIDCNCIESPASHQQELDHRLARYEKGETAFFSWDDIKKDIHF